MGQVFNPFGKPFKDILEEDLSILKTVSEGWYIEYKREKQSGEKIAKSISSFANSYGGIYFIGIEHDEKTNYCKNIDGIIDSPDVIRDAVRNSIQPFPYFETVQIPLKNGKKVIMAVVSEGENPPYIHSNGRIYRRQEAGSDPIEENERHVIDMLYSKAEEIKNELETFRKIDYAFCIGEQDIPYLEIFINIKPFNHFILENFFTEEKLASLLKKFNEPFVIKENIAGGDISFNVDIKFDSLNTYHNSVTMRNLADRSLTYNGLSVELDIHGNAKFLIPLVQITYNIEKFDKRYNNVINKSHRGSIHDIKLLHMKSIFVDIFGLVNKYFDFIMGNGFNENVQVKLRLSNCWRTSLYSNSEAFIKQVEDFGLPICMKPKQYFPLEPLEIKINDLNLHPISQNLIFSYVAIALGIPPDISIMSVLEEMIKNQKV
jgi:hypothetical protein